MGETFDDTTRRATLSLERLQHALRQVGPAVVLVPSWVLENVIAVDRGVGGPLFTIPHDRSHVIARDRLVQIASDEDLPLPDDLPDEPTIILLARPDNDWLDSTAGPDALLAYWRLLFHAQVDALFRAKRSDGSLDDPRVQQRIERLGRSAFREAGFVLARERELPGGADDAETYAEFAAAYLELLHFEPWLLHWYFPAADGERVLSVLADDVDAAKLFEQTRLPGAAEPRQEAAPDPEDEAARPPAPVAEPGSTKPEKDPGKAKALLRRADAAEERGNDVRAALLRARAARVMRNEESGRLRSSAARRMDALASRLRAALNLGDAEYDPWRAVLRALLTRADLGWWNNERRLLYDLQKACVCHEREMYSANVVEWVLDRGRRPLRRPQPAQRLVTAHKALRSAERRAAKARLHPHDQAALRKLLHAAALRAEHRVRTDLRPLIITALEEGDLAPVGAVERVAEEKLVDELLDGVVRRGYLNLGNLRDAVSRNQLKLNDLSGPRELFGRDQLLRADRRLEWQLDGVYHRGEVYLRFFQRLSALLFGTATGRFLTRVLLIPFIGAFVVLEGLDHSVGAALKKLAHAQVHFAEPAPVVLLALFIMALVNWPAFRAATARGGRALGRGLRAALIDFPRWLARLPLVRFLFNSQLARLVVRWVVKPMALSALVLLVLPSGLPYVSRTAVLGVVYAVVTLLLNTPAGRAFEQTVLHALRVTVPRRTWDILLGLFRIVMQAFDRLLESVDRALYAVDEWLRFGSTQGRSAIVVKAALGVVWFYVAYITRFVVNLLVEPQINPIKHFPVVTVSHKIMIPVTPALAKGFMIAGLNEGTAWTLAGGIITGTPGVFGFLAWELKENWKLYRRNRPRTLRPVRVGSHGETFAQLLRPGFHSGTLPKLFARVRKSARRARIKGLVAAGPGPRERAAAHHVQEDIRAFVERELVNLLNRHPLWTHSPVAVGEIELAATRVRIELLCESLGKPDAPAVLSFDHRDGYILAAGEQPGWMPSLDPAQVQLLRVALVGFYKLAAVDLVAEHVQSVLGPARIRLDVRRRQLVTWNGDGFDRETAHDLAASADDPAVRRLLFRHVNVPWPLWRRVWDARTPAEVAESTAQIAPGIDVLPAGCESHPAASSESNDRRPQVSNFVKV